MCIAVTKQKSFFCYLFIRIRFGSQPVPLNSPLVCPVRHFKIYLAYNPSRAEYTWWRVCLNTLGKPVCSVRQFLERLRIYISKLVVILATPQFGIWSNQLCISVTKQEVYIVTWSILTIRCAFCSQPVPQKRKLGSQ